jgi:DNA-binding GntR family transcriptional regulator
MERVRRASGGQLVYEELRRRILELELEPGTRLFEPQLAAALQVSRTPLREALRLLLAEDLLDQLPTGGMVVRPLSRRDVDELYGVRGGLEGVIAARAAERCDERAAVRLRALLDRNERLVGLAGDAMGAGHDLHVLIGEVADHAWATRLLDQIDGQLARYRRFTNQTQERREAALVEHTGLVEAVTAGDPSTARERAEAHVAHAREAALAALGTDLP